MNVWTKQGYSIICGYWEMDLSWKLWCKVNTAVVAGAAIKVIPICLALATWSHARQKTDPVWKYNIELSFMLLVVILCYIHLGICVLGQFAVVRPNALAWGKWVYRQTLQQSILIKNALTYSNLFFSRFSIFESFFKFRSVSINLFLKSCTLCMSKACGS